MKVSTIFRCKTTLIQVKKNLCIFFLLLLATMNIEPGFLLLDVSIFDIFLLDNGPYWVEHEFAFRDIFLGDYLPLVSIIISVHLFYYGSYKFIFFWLLYISVKENWIYVRLGKIGCLVLCFFLTGVLFVHNGILFIILFYWWFHVRVLGFLLFTIYFLQHICYQPW